MFPKGSRLPRSVFLGKPHRRARFAYGSASFFRDASPRAVVIVSKKVARDAVDRNAIRRRVLHALKKLHPHLTHSVAVYPSSAARRAPFQELLTSLEEVVRTR